MFYNIKIKKLKEIGKKKRKKGTPYYIYTCARNRDKEEWQWEEWDKRTDGKYKKKAKGIISHYGEEVSCRLGKKFLQAGKEKLEQKEGQFERKEEKNYIYTKYAIYYARFCIIISKFAAVLE